MQTLALIGRRILYAALLLLAVIVLNFTLIRLAPGDIVQTIAGQMGGMNEELMLELRHSFQLDKSIPEQLLIYIGKVAHGDLGYSYFFNQPFSTSFWAGWGPRFCLCSRRWSSRSWRGRCSARWPRAGCTARSATPSPS